MRGVLAGVRKRYSRDALFWLSAVTVLIITPALLLFASMGILETRRLAAQERAAIAEASSIRAEVRQLMVALLDAQASQRGYFLSGDEALLLRNHQDRSTALRELQDLERMLADRPRQRRQLGELHDAVAAVFAGMQVAELARVRQGQAAGAASAAGPRSEALMARARALGDHIIDAQTAETAASVARSRQQAGRADRLVVSTTGLAALALVGAGVMAFRYTRLRTSLIEGARAEAARRRSIFDSTMDAIVTITPRGEIDGLNRAAEEMFGYPQAELLGKDVSVLGPLADQARTLVSDGSTPLNGACEFEGRRKDGSLIAIDVNLGRMPQPDGVHVVAVMRDCTQRRQTERAKDEFISTVSHELRTPLTSIAGSLGLLAGGAGGQLPQMAGRLVGIAEANSRRLVRLINDLLDYQKIRAGEMKLERASVELSELVARAIEAMAGLQDDLQVRFVYAAPPGPLKVEGDADRLAQVTTNLLSNAAKFSPTGGEVRVVLSRQGPWARLEVADQGPGVPPEFRSRIFGRFAQADSSDTRSKSGTGLGLAISKEIVEGHGGRIGFGSPPGGGAVFFVELPALEA